MREIRYVEAIRDALSEEMERDESVFLLGAGIGPRGGAFNQANGLWAKFGPKRVVDTPISELGFTGLAVAAAMAGLRPVVDISFWDFSFEAMGQLVEQAARVHYISNGKIKVPLVMHGSIGVWQSAGGHHSGNLYTMYAHLPGVKVVVPSTPYDVKGLIKTAIRDDDPVLIFEHKGLYNTRGPVPDEEYLVPFGRAVIHREGTDVTVVATARMVLLALEAADKLAAEGISVEVFDPCTLVPFDKSALLRSIRKTNRVVVVDESYAPYGLGSEIAAIAADEAFYDLDSPIKRVQPLSIPAPVSPVLEKAMVPDVDQVCSAVREVMNQ